MTATLHLLACPFCGSEPVIDEIDRGIFAICCDMCKTIGPHCDGEQSIEEAARDWNTRGGKEVA
jgi:Lar family restriction alleviation protein